MNQNERTWIGRRNILLVLRDCEGCLLPETSLLDQVRLQVQPPPTCSEFAEWLQWLDSNAYVAGIRPELGGPVKWKITDKGKLAL